MIYIYIFSCLFSHMLTNMQYIKKTAFLESTKKYTWHTFDSAVVSLNMYQALVYGITNPFVLICILISFFRTTLYGRLMSIARAMRAPINGLWASRALHLLGKSKNSTFCNVAKSIQIHNHFCYTCTRTLTVDFLFTQ